ncbi:GGDEF domain-containing protein [Gordonia asplenii]|uniref:GGDEF domain-containing protein n=1 Tax=Gordonia asplenii TaxID=2725283 RepID=UPI001B7D49DC|nr:diguanylate cyclase [Gordonia asplenii]
MVNVARAVLSGDLSPGAGGLDVDGATISTTVAIGVTPVDPGSDSLDDALSHADQALYRAKRQGPNRVQV